MEEWQVGNNRACRWCDSDQFATLATGMHVCTNPACPYLWFEKNTHHEPYAWYAALSRHSAGVCVAISYLGTGGHRE